LAFVTAEGDGHPIESAVVIVRKMLESRDDALILQPTESRDPRARKSSYFGRGAIGGQLVNPNVIVPRAGPLSIRPWFRRRDDANVRQKTEHHERP
jgi:hypothetical protein